MIAALRRLRHGGHDVILFHILDEAEVGFPFSGLVELEEPETHTRLEVDADSFRRDYLAEVESFREHYRRECFQSGIDYVAARHQHAVRPGADRIFGDAPLASMRHQSQLVDDSRRDAETQEQSGSDETEYESKICSARLTVKCLLVQFSPRLCVSARDFPACESSKVHFGWPHGICHTSTVGRNALIGVPIVLHLIMRREVQQFVFPALRFVQQRKAVNQHRLRLRQLLLLALRCASILLLAFALARPTLRGSGAGARKKPDRRGAGVRQLAAHDVRA